MAELSAEEAWEHWCWTHLEAPPLTRREAFMAGFAAGRRSKALRKKGQGV